MQLLHIQGGVPQNMRGVLCNSFLRMFPREQFTEVFDVTDVTSSS